MDDKNAALAAEIVSANYIDSGVASLRSVHKRLRDLLASRTIPAEGWPDSLVEDVVRDLSRMDSNNFLDNVGVGEREGRVACGLVARRHFGLSHGIGRSGDIAAEQPKAAGSSLILKLTNALALDYVRGICGMRRLKACVVMPMATGMTFSVVLLQLRQVRPQARVVVWQRCDQKSCFKALLTAGLTPVVVENVAVGDELTTNVAGIEAAVAKHGAENVLCIALTTSTFAPRVPDDVPAVAVLAKRLDVPLVVNNAYGLQSTRCCHLINEGCRVGRVDAVVQSTDKNLLVPVGGAIVASPSKEFIDAMAKLYPGRASMSPILDVFLTLLSLGRHGLQDLLAQRKAVHPHLKAALDKVAAKHGERVLATKHNTISIAMTLDKLDNAVTPAGSGRSSDSGGGGGGRGGVGDGGGGASEGKTFVGSMLFRRCVSGTRVVTGHGLPIKNIGPHRFAGFGSHADDYPHSYLTAAAAVGVSTAEVDVFAKRLDAAITEFKKKRKRAACQREKAASTVQGLQEVAATPAAAVAAAPATAVALETEATPAVPATAVPAMMGTAVAAEATVQSPAGEGL